MEVTTNRTTIKSRIVVDFEVELITDPGEAIVDFGTEPDNITLTEDQVAGELLEFVDYHLGSGPLNQYIANLGGSSETVQTAGGNGGQDIISYAVSRESGDAEVEILSQAVNALAVRVPKADVEKVFVDIKKDYPANEYPAHDTL